MRPLFPQGSAAIVGFALVTLACGGTTSGTQGPASTAASPTPAAIVKTATKKVADKSQNILVDSKGLTLYYFTTDKGGRSPAPVLVCRTGPHSCYPPA